MHFHIYIYIQTYMYVYLYIWLCARSWLSSTTVDRHLAPALTEEHLKGKGKKIFPRFVENCDFLINKNMIFHEFTRIVT